MKIETYQEKTEGSILHGTFKPVAKGNYELTNTNYYDSIWASNIKFWEQITQKHDNYIGEISEGCFKFDLGIQYGIHSYQLVYPTKELETTKGKTFALHSAAVHIN